MYFTGGGDQSGVGRGGVRLFFLSLSGNCEKFRNWRRETGRFPSLFHSGEHAATDGMAAATGIDREQIYPAEEGEACLRGLLFPLDVTVELAGLGPNY